MPESSTPEHTDDHVETDAASVSGETPATPSARARGARPTRPAVTRRRTSPRRLIETRGPDPATALTDAKLTVGVIASTHGVRGDLKLKILTDHPEHLPTVREVFLGESDTPTRLVSARMHGDQMLIHLDGVDTPEEGKRLGGLKVRIRATDARPLEPGEYFLFQLIGLEAVTEEGAVLGTVTDLMETGAHDVLVITAPESPDLLVPNHPNYVLDVAPERNTIVIRPPVYTS